MPDPLLVLGIGNEFRGDDAAGLLVARRLRLLAPEGVRAVEVTGDVLQALDQLGETDRVVIVDAVVSGRAPGTIHWIDLATPLPAGLRSASTHSMSIASAIELARTLGTLPADAVLAGIEAGECVVGSAVSETVMGAVEDVVGRIKDLSTSLRLAEMGRRNPLPQGEGNAKRG